MNLIKQMKGVFSMNKTVKTILMVLGVVVLAAAIILAIFKLNGKSGESLIEVNSGDDLAALIDEIYEGQTNLFSTLETAQINVTEADMVAFNTGLANGDNLEYLAISQPLMSSQAYELVIAKVKQGVDANAVAKEMSENINMNKWICVSANKLYATSSGDIVFLVMAGEADMAKPIYEKFKSLAGNVNEVYEKDAEEIELPPEILL